MAARRSADAQEIVQALRDLPERIAASVAANVSRPMREALQAVKRQGKGYGPRVERTKKGKASPQGRVRGAKGRYAEAGPYQASMRLLTAFGGGEVAGQIAHVKEMFDATIGFAREVGTAFAPLFKDANTHVPRPKEEAEPAPLIEKPQTSQAGSLTVTEPPKYFDPLNEQPPTTPRELGETIEAPSKFVPLINEGPATTSGGRLGQVAPEVPGLPAISLRSPSPPEPLVASQPNVFLPAAPPPFEEYAKSASALSPGISDPATIAPSLATARLPSPPKFVPGAQRPILNLPTEKYGAPGGIPQKPRYVTPWWKEKVGVTHDAPAGAVGTPLPWLDPKTVRREIPDNYRKEVAREISREPLTPGKAFAPPFPQPAVPKPFGPSATASGYAAGVTPAAPLIIPPATADPVPLSIDISDKAAAQRIAEQELSARPASARPIEAPAIAAAPPIAAAPSSGFEKEFPLEKAIILESPAAPPAISPPSAESPAAPPAISPPSAESPAAPPAIAPPSIAQTSAAPATPPANAANPSDAMPPDYLAPLNDKIRDVIAGPVKEFQDSVKDFKEIVAALKGSSPFEMSGQPGHHTTAEGRLVDVLDRLNSTLERLAGQGGFNPSHEKPRRADRDGEKRMREASKGGGVMKTLSAVHSGVAGGAKDLETLVKVAALFV